MTQNTEQNVRTRDEQVADLVEALSDEVWVPDHKSYCEKMILEAEARGAEEQRRKDAEASDKALDEVMVERDNAEEFIGELVERVLGHSVEWSSSYGFGSAFIDVADHVDALEAEITSLKEAEQLARADAEASKAGRCKDQEVIRWLAEKLAIADPDLKADCDLLSRAALTREGGV